jgi:hypothetical protein
MPLDRIADAIVLGATGELGDWLGPISFNKKIM